ncbi:hypothetical protein EGR_05013 [Echinococcus granulosus]|uniref:Uncharacterized protein n=1 Tax=Echinococcus granulosus TaxID=6210 RepID=W6UFG0_ECHGR|nr:hypothetical protein EGR_05013 [Echinococcus granulosus]EUB60160.1 hypothetical protein EGR_05013 [Echinococcus granulosus]
METNPKGKEEEEDEEEEGENDHTCNIQYVVECTDVFVYIISRVRSVGLADNKAFAARGY